MATTPDVPGVPDWSQAVIGVCIFLGTIGAMVTRFLSGKKAPEPNRMVTIEAAELADLSVIRAIAPKLDQVLKMEQQVEDVRESLEAVEQRQQQMLEILGRMDRKEEMRALIREERQSHDERGNPRQR